MKLLYAAQRHALFCRVPCAARAPGREPPPQSALTERHVAGRARIGGGASSGRPGGISHGRQDQFSHPRHCHRAVRLAEEIARAGGKRGVALIVTTYNADLGSFGGNAALRAQLATGNTLALRA